MKSRIILGLLTFISVVAIVFVFSCKRDDVECIECVGQRVCEDVYNTTGGKVSDKSWDEYKTDCQDCIECKGKTICKITFEALPASDTLSWERYKQVCETIDVLTK